MPRTARLVVPHLPHHVIQRGNRRQRTFFCARDFELYRELLAERCREAGLVVWAYCLLPNHVHLILVPETETSLARGLGRVHRIYTTAVNRREGWRGCLWQGRFSSYAMDEGHLLAATRYLLVNPVRAGLVSSPVDWPYSSARAHLRGENDGLVEPAGLARLVSDWLGFLSEESSPREGLRIRGHASSGLPAGGESFLAALEARTGRTLRHPLGAAGCPSVDETAARGLTPARGISDGPRTAFNESPTQA